MSKRPMSNMHPLRPTREKRYWSTERQSPEAAYFIYTSTVASAMMGIDHRALIAALESTGRFDINRDGHEYAYSAELWNRIADHAGLVPAVRLTSPSSSSRLYDRMVIDIRHVYDACGRRSMASSIPEPP